MKKAILALMLAAICNGAWAGWVKVATDSEGGIYYVDPATVRRSGNLRRVWEIMDSKLPDKGGVMSSRIFAEYDCKEERVRGLSISMHSQSMAGGSVLRTDSKPGDWDYVAPGTVGAIKLSYVCSLKP
jgi:hypothetical protein